MNEEDKKYKFFVFWLLGYLKKAKEYDRKVVITTLENKIKEITGEKL